MSEAVSTFIKKATPSACYWGFWRGIQDSTDGRTTLIDGSGKGRDLVMGANATYANVVGTNAGYATIIGAASPTDRSVATAAVLTWDMFAGQSLIVAATMKAAAPGATAHLFNARGSSGDVKGMSILMDSLGKPSVVVRDTASSFVSTVPSEVFTDSTDHQIIVAIDGTGKRLYIWRDGTGVSNTGQTITATAGTTQGDDVARWGAAGDFASGNGTWVSAANLQLKDMHVLVMPYWPANITNIVAELVRNPHRPLPARMLPATASA